jgi:hypothetical protein
MDGVKSRSQLATLVLAATAAFAAAACGGGAGEARTPSKGRIVFARFDASLSGTVTNTMNPDGSDVKRLFSRGQSEFPHWSPDGGQIAIFCCDDGMAASHRLRAPALHPTAVRWRHLGSEVDGLLYPGWSPDGTKIVFTRVTGGTESDIHTVNTDGSGLFRVTKTGGGDQPDWGG